MGIFTNYYGRLSALYKIISMSLEC